MPPRASLRTRLTAWVVAIFVFIQLITGVMYWAFQRRTIEHAFEEAILERARSLAAEVAMLPPGSRPDEAELDAIIRRKTGFAGQNRFAVDVVNGEGRSLISSPAKWPATSRRLAPGAIGTGEAQRGRLVDPAPGIVIEQGARATALALPFGPYRGERAVLMLATSDAPARRQIMLVTRSLVIGGLLGVAASAATGWFIAGIAVAPLRRLSSVAEQLSPETLDRELVMDSPSAEVAQLAGELDRARERIRRAFAAQDRFLSNISHELKTPIATLLLEAQTIDRSTLTEEGREFVLLVEEEMRKLGRLVESFLTLARVRDGAGVTRSQLCSANELVMQSVEDCLPMAEQYSVRLDPRLAEGDAIGSMVAGDPELLRTLLNNLIRNAIRFSPKGGRVQVEAWCDGGTFRVAVRDEGPGLPAEIVDRLFDRFAQEAVEARRERGHGLGLAIAKGIAEIHGGDIRASNLGEGGAEFEVTLPLGCADESADPAPAEPEAAG